MTVKFAIKDNVAYVTIDRPERMNAVDQPTEEALEKIWCEIEGNKNIYCVVLTGSGEKAFSAGADMKSPGNYTGLEYWAHLSANGFGGIALRDTLNVPVIARVNGLALGGGFEMILGCDIVVATHDSSFGLPESRVGRLALAGGMVLLQRQIPEKIASGIILSGRRISASEAYQYGLVNNVVARESLDATVQSWVDDIKRCAPLSVRALKDTIRNTAHMKPKEAQFYRSETLVAALVSNDSEEGVQAFIEKRPPLWSGK